MLREKQELAVKKQQIILEQEKQSEEQRKLARQTEQILEQQANLIVTMETLYPEKHRYAQYMHVLVPKDVAGVILWGRPSTPELQRMWEPVSTFEMHQKAMKYKSVSTFEDVRNAVKAGKMSMKQGRNILEEFVQHCPLSNDPRCKFCNYRLLPFLFIY